MPQTMRFALGLLIAALLYQLYITAVAIVPMMQHGILSINDALHSTPGGYELDKGTRAMLVLVNVFMLAFVSKSLVALLFTGAVFKRKHWGRIGWALFTLLDLAMLILAHTVSGAGMNRPAHEVMLANAAVVAQMLGVYLLFSAGARPWFRRRDAQDA